MKQESKDFSTKLWEYPTGRLAHNESAELLWKGHLTTFQLTSFKRFQLDAIRAIEAKKDVGVIQMTGIGKSICFQVPSVFDSTRDLSHDITDSLSSLKFERVRDKRYCRWSTTSS